jgi:hypothetical protein
MKAVKIWIDDVREPPSDDWLMCRSVVAAKTMIKILEENNFIIEVISIDHDAGDYERFGGDYIKVLDWLEENNKSFPIHIHTMNPVGRQNMEAIIRRNNWVEVRHLWN